MSIRPSKKRSSRRQLRLESLESRVLMAADLRWNLTPNLEMVVDMHEQAQYADAQTGDKSAQESSERKKDRDREPQNDRQQGRDPADLNRRPDARVRDQKSSTGDRRERFGKANDTGRGVQSRERNSKQDQGSDRRTTNPRAEGSPWPSDEQPRSDGTANRVGKSSSSQVVNKRQAAQQGSKTQAKTITVQKSNSAGNDRSASDVKQAIRDRSALLEKRRDRAAGDPARQEQIADKISDLSQEYFAKRYDEILSDGTSEMSEAKYNGAIKDLGQLVVDMEATLGPGTSEVIKATETILKIHQEYYTDRFNDLKKTTDGDLTNKEIVKKLKDLMNLGAKVQKELGPEDLAIEINEKITDLAKQIVITLPGSNSTDNTGGSETGNSNGNGLGIGNSNGTDSGSDGETPDHSSEVKDRINSALLLGEVPGGNTGDTGLKRPESSTGNTVDYGGGSVPDLGDGTDSGAWDSGSGGGGSGSGGSSGGTGSGGTGRPENTLDGERDPNRNSSSRTSQGSSSTEDTSSTEGASSTEDTSSSEDTSEEVYDNKKWSHGETSGQQYDYKIFDGNDGSLPPDHPDAVLGNEQLKQRHSEWVDLIDQHWSIDEKADRNADINWGDEGRPVGGNVADATPLGSGDDCFTGVPTTSNGGSGLQVSGGNQGSVDAPGGMQAGLPSEYYEMRWLSDMFQDAGSFGPGSGQGSNGQGSSDDEEEDEDEKDEKDEEEEYEYVDW